MIIIIRVDKKIHDKYREQVIQWSTHVSSQVYKGQKLINEYLKLMYFDDLYLLPKNIKNIKNNKNI